MTGTAVNGSGNGERPGAQPLLLLATPLIAPLLRTLSRGPGSQADLRRETGFPAQSTLRAQLKRLVAIGAVEKRRRDRFPGALEYELSPVGDNLLVIAGTLDSWLAKGPLEGGQGPSGATVKALAGAWSTTMLRALAARPLSLTELDGLIASVSYPSLERRLAAMRLTRLVERHPDGGRGTPYALTEWARMGVTPLVAALRWERRHRNTTAPAITQIDIETVFLLSVPLLKLPISANGSVRLAAEIPDNKPERLAGVTVSVTDGLGTACTTRLDGPVDAWAQGSVDDWLGRFGDATAHRLVRGGTAELARTLVERLLAGCLSSGSEQSVPT